MRSSMATASAQPMSLPPDFQLGRRRHALHLSLTTMPTPVVELASENPPTSVMYRLWECLMIGRGGKAC